MAAPARWSAVLLRLVYLSVTNMFALLRLLPASDLDKDTEILVLRHQITVLELPCVSRTENSRLIYAAVSIPRSSSMTSRGVLYPSVE
jgi:hypothetical protein